MALSKKDYVAALTKADVPLTGEEAVADLKKLADEHNVEVAAVDPADDANSASVISGTGQHVRTYSREVHGDEFADLAKEFSDHTPGSTVELH